MLIVFAILKSIATIISFYSTLCFIRIILTWIPGMQYNKIGQFFSMICDPYLNIFSRIKFMRIGMIDFSPILAFALLSGISQILMQICSTGRFSLAFVIAVIIKFAWEVLASMLILLVIMIVIRLVMMISKKDNNPFWGSIDSLIYKIASPITKIFCKNKFVSIKANTIIALIETVLLYAAGKIAIYYIIQLCFKIPF